MTRKTKKNNMIPLRDLKSYLKNIYESPNVADNIPSVSIEEKVFSIEDIEFGFNHLAKGKAKDI
jgi:hypothetical protein